MSEKNYDRSEAISKLKEMVNSIDICFLCTDIQNGKMNAAPMSRQEVDDNASIWFLANAESDTCQNISSDSKVCLHFSDTSKYQFLTVCGTATVSSDKTRIEKYWNPIMESWFEKGKDDPSIRVIEVKADDARYWETKDGKMVTMFKMAVGAITGNSMDTGNEGNLEF